MKRVLTGASLIGVAMSLANAAGAQQQAPKQQMDSDFAASVKQWTTRPEFMTPLVDHLPLSTTIPSPKQVFGHHIGVPNVLHSQAEINGYFRKLAAAAPDRVRIIEIGKTNEGRDNIVVMISDAENIARLDQYKANLAKLADPRRITPAEATRIIGETKPIYHVTAGLHSAETGPPEMVMELAYRLLTEDSPLIRQIGKNLVVAFTPVLEADGRDRYRDWYYRHLIDEKDDLNKPASTPYWGKYIYHDNNRDINFSDPSAREMMQYYLEWHPPIMHELHESVPFLYTYSGQAPQNPDLDPILYGELPFYSNFEMSQLTKMGLPGVWTHGFVDAWSPGYVGFMASNHNGMLRMYETFGNAGATTMLRHIDTGEVGPGARGGNQTARDWYRPSPAYKEVEWSMRNNTNYMETGVLTALQLASTFPDVILENFYKKSANGVAAGAAKAPYAYIIPANQSDPTRVKFVVDTLQLQGIEIGKANGAIKLGDKSYPAGSLVIKLNQPYGRLAKTLLKVQDNYPDDDMTTYDDAAWTMGLMTHTNIVQIADKAVLDVPTTPLDRFVVNGAIGGAGAGGYAVLDTGSVNLAQLRFRLKDVAVRVAEKPFKAGGREVPAGSLLIPASAGGQLKPLIEELGLTAVAAPGDPGVPTHDMPIPRVALFSTWGSTQSVGWVRYAFDQYKTPYDLIFKEQVRAGDLRAKYDVIILPDQGRSPKDVVFDLPMKGKPLPYDASKDFPTMGMYGSSPDIRGGMGLEGLEELRKFVAAGGLLITTGKASGVPGGFGLVDDVSAGGVSKDFYAPGPIVKANVLQPASPLFYGYSQKTMPVRWASNVLLGVPKTAKQYVLMEFPGGKKSVMSGFMKGAEEVKDRPAIVNMPVGAGRVVMFATNPIWRWQNLGEYRMLYNAMLNWKALGGANNLAPVKPDEGAPLGKTPRVDDGSKPTGLTGSDDTGTPN